ncbi:MAG: hypothetical protein GC181_05435 [Bacteroidetes bacterium]|nr:hypothetical protein [Bacteroidota bacterium]
MGLGRYKFWKPFLIVLLVFGFVSAPILTALRPPGEPFGVLTRPVWRDIIANFLMACFFFINFKLLLPKLSKPSNQILYISIVLAAFLIIAWLPTLITGGFNPPHMHHHGEHPSIQKMPPMKPRSNSELSELMRSILHQLYLFIAVVIFSHLLFTRTRLTQVSKAHHEAREAYLKSQINPHFLFNTLNGLYGLAIREKAESTSTGILRLAGMMRYVVYDTANDFVAIGKEIQYMRDYIELQELRLSTNTELTLNFRENYVEEPKIAPMLLMTFVENAFKYGVNPDIKSTIKIDLTVDDTSVDLKVKNNVVAGKSKTDEDESIGLSNTVTRLEQLYPKRYYLSTTENDGEYEIHLNIKIS